MGRKRTKAAAADPSTASIAGSSAAAATVAGSSNSEPVLGPMAPLSTKSSLNSNAPPKKKHQKNGVDRRRRSIADNLQELYGSASALEADIARHNKLHFAPVVETTLRDYARVKDAYIQWMIWRFEGDPTRATQSIAQNSPFPSMETVKTLYRTLATSGISKLGVAGAKGWSLKTLMKYHRQFVAMWKRETGVTASPEQYEQLVNFCNTLALEDKIVVTTTREKKIVRLEDFFEIIAKIMDPSFVMRSASQRLQLHVICCLLFTGGQRPSAIVEGRGCKNTKKCLAWGDIKIFFVGWSKETGPQIQALFSWLYMKGMSLNEGRKSTSNLTTLPIGSAAVDGLLSLLALAIHRDVTELPGQTVLEMLETGDPPQFPFEFKIKESAKSEAVFLLLDGVGAATYSSLRNLLSKVGRELGWPDLNSRGFRYGFAAEMSGKIADHHLKYIMGHTLNSEHANTTYQTAFRPVDLSAARFGNEGHTDVINFASSVAYGAKSSTPFTKQQSDTLMVQMQSDAELQDLMLTHAKVVSEISSQFPDMSLEEFVAQNPTHDLVEQEAECKIDIMVRYGFIYNKLSYKLPPNHSKKRAAASVAGPSTQPLPDPSAIVEPTLLVFDHDFSDISSILFATDNEIEAIARADALNFSPDIMDEFLNDFPVAPFSENHSASTSTSLSTSFSLFSTPPTLSTMASSDCADTSLFNFSYLDTHNFSPSSQFGEYSSLGPHTPSMLPPTSAEYPTAGPSSGPSHARAQAESPEWGWSALPYTDLSSPATQPPESPLLSLASPFEWRYPPLPHADLSSPATQPSESPLPLASPFEWGYSPLPHTELSSPVMQPPESPLLPPANELPNLPAVPTAGPSKELQAIMKNSMQTLAASSPLQNMALMDKCTGRVRLIRHYLELLDTDALLKKRICPFCYSDDSKSDKDRKKEHPAASWKKHLHRCEEEHLQGHQRCTLCAGMVPDHSDILEAHYEQCYNSWLHRTTLDFTHPTTDESDDKDSVDDEPEEMALVDNMVKWDRGDLNCIAVNRTLGSQSLEGRRVYFCPVCIFDDTLPWKRRLYALNDGKAMRTHLVGHVHMAQNDSRFNTLGTHHCPFPKCSQDDLRLADWFNHMSDHGYLLLTYSPGNENAEIKPRLAPWCTEIMYLTEATAFCIAASTPLPTVCVIDNGQKAQRNTREARGRKDGAQKLKSLTRPNS
ncbi:hypothetical protein BJ138DRAFT_586644 [Hygrophoropsis aurantiaca]|uniref:Uncharacterized protein n=1 Tax=Hygrophoropsis aurantiaca TaxID=72124 RepID=A0ACB8AJE8_9AGAM|nr:hypothetical protein BJ138DRAFT_586644 [Hygrophoropsis aurantiaca]